MVVDEGVPEDDDELAGILSMMHPVSTLRMVRQAGNMINDLYLFMLASSQKKVTIIILNC